MGKEMMIVTLPVKVWDRLIDVMQLMNNGDVDENVKQRHLGYLVGLFNEWEREVTGEQKIRYGEAYYGWDHDTLVDLKVGIRNKRMELAELEKAEATLPDSVIEEYNAIRV